MSTIMADQAFIADKVTEEARPKQIQKNSKN